MEFETSRVFRVWKYRVSHRQLHLRSTGSRFPEPVDQIDIHFRATVRFDLDVEFIVDSIESFSGILQVSRKKYASNHGRERSYLFKFSNEIVGRVDAAYFEVLHEPLPELVRPGRLILRNKES